MLEVSLTFIIANLTYAIRYSNKITHNKTHCYHVPTYLCM